MNDTLQIGKLIVGIRPGYYAVSLDGTDQLKFIRVSVRKERANMKAWQLARVGNVVIQSQHGESLIFRCEFKPDGTPLSNHHQLVTNALLIILADQQAAARRYATELGQCCRCAKELTDARSRYYGIGPECEKHWPDFVGSVDELEGAYVPQVA